MPLTLRPFPRAQFAHIKLTSYRISGREALASRSQGGDSTSEDAESYTNHVPVYAKFLIIVQTFVIIYFLFWSFEEYANNYYFQSYVNATLQGSGFAIVALGSLGVFTAIAAGLYMRLRQTRKELLHIAVAEAPAVETRDTDSVLTPHVEQHLINMIRKSTTTDSASGSMPVLKREQPSGQAR